MKVLVVDDDPDMRRLLSLALGHVGGMEVVTISGGESIVEAVAADNFDAVVLDVMMPVLDGPQCLALLRANESTRNIPVVFLTAKGDTEDLDNLREKSGFETLRKPFDPLTLAETLRRMLGKE
ncbi:MAG TPA: response regulator [Planctomycetes bacterium]|nr:response regulator [Planctomycetota bacterium]HIL38312.1 response regulator [Planctomycetota bacterium]